MDWFNDRETTLFMNKGYSKYFGATKKHLDNSKVDKANLQFAIVLKDEKKSLIGSIGIHKIDWVHRTGDISILIGKR